MPHRTFRRHYLRLATISMTCGFAMAAVGYLPTLRLGGEGGVVAMLYGLSASLVASMIGAIPVSHAMAQPRVNAPIAILLGTALRFLVILLLVASLAFSGLVDRVALVTWVAISYLVLLLVDTLASLAGLKTMQGANR